MGFGRGMIATFVSFGEWIAVGDVTSPSSEVEINRDGQDVKTDDDRSGTAGVVV